jgi:uridine phosphorylase
MGPGEIANRIITVGSVSRQEKIVANFDTTTPIHRVTSSRGFVTATGTYRGIPVSCVAIGMGPAMMDFFVRESMAVLNGPVAIIRFIVEENFAPTTPL